MCSVTKKLKKSKLKFISGLYHTISSVQFCFHAVGNPTRTCVTHLLLFIPVKLCCQTVIEVNWWDIFRLQLWYHFHRQSQRRRVLCNGQSAAPMLVLSLRMWCLQGSAILLASSQVRLCICPLSCSWMVAGCQSLLIIKLCSFNIS